MNNDSKQESIKLNGYRASHRNKWRLLQHNILNLQELSLLEFYADIAGFDKNNQWYGIFKTEFPNFAAVFRKSESTVRNWHNKLLEIGVIQQTEKRGEFRVACFDRYITPGKWAGKAAQYAELEKDQPIGVILQNFGINLQSVGEKLQPVEEKKEKEIKKPQSIAISSSKVQSSVYPKKVVIQQPVRSDEEYRDLQRKHELSRADMKWIDENVKEGRTMNNEATEKDYVEIFFEGDWESYRKHLVTT